MSPSFEQRLDLRPATERERGGDESERDRRGARAEAAGERNPIREDEPLAFEGHAAEGPQAQVLGPFGDLARALAAHFDAGTLGDLELFQRSSAAPAQSKPEPRFAVVAGARTRTGRLTGGSTGRRRDGVRVGIDLERGARGALDRSGVLEPVTGDHAHDAGAGLERFTLASAATPAADEGFRRHPRAPPALARRRAARRP